MNLKKIFFSAVTVSVLCALTGCDYIEEGKPESSLLKQQEEHNNKIELIEKQQAQLKSQLDVYKRQVSTRSGYLCRHINKKPRASSLRDSKHKKGCFYVIRY